MLIALLYPVFQRQSPGTTGGVLRVRFGFKYGWAWALEVRRVCLFEMQKNWKAKMIRNLLKSPFFEEWKQLYRGELSVQKVFLQYGVLCTILLYFAAILGDLVFNGLSSILVLILAIYLGFITGQLYKCLPGDFNGNVKAVALYLYADGFIASDATLRPNTQSNLHHYKVDTEKVPLWLRKEEDATLFTR